MIGRIMNCTAAATGTLPTGRMLFEGDGFKVVRSRCAVQDPFFVGAQPTRTAIVWHRRPVWVQPENAAAFVADSTAVVVHFGSMGWRRRPIDDGGDEADWFIFDRTFLDSWRARRPSSLLFPSFPFRVPCAGRLLALLRLIVQTVEDHSRAGVADAMLLLLDAVADSASWRTPGSVSRDNLGRVENAREVLGRSYMRSISTPEIASCVGLVPFQLARLFRCCTGMTLQQYRTELRLRAAWNELRDWPGDLDALARALGFSSHSHFASAFRRATGLSPSEARDVDRRFEWLIRAALYNRNNLLSR